VADHTPLSRRRARAVIAAGGVRVDGTPCTQASASVMPGAMVEVRDVAQAVDTPAVPERYRDAHLLIVDKPSGLPTQAPRTGGDHHLYAMLQAQEAYVGLHHRLDTPASGLVLFTLDKRANRAIADGFRTGSIRRRYQAALVGDPGAAGTWETDIDGRSARTHWRRLALGDGISIVEASLETGRTHQIRRHAVEHGHPVLGDRRHGGAAGRIWPRLALHAEHLALDHPISGEPLVIQSPLPPDLMELWDRVLRRCTPGP
jgi:23S rRNA-/tRNA-specific pseudouridylate synthase